MRRQKIDLFIVYTVLVSSSFVWQWIQRSGASLSGIGVLARHFFDVHCAIQLFL